MPKLTKRFVESWKPDTADAIAWDDDIPGFGLRVLSSRTEHGEERCVRSYLVQYRTAQGRSRRLTLGKHGKLTADMARKEAFRVFDAVRAGKDPVAERRASIEAPVVNELLDRYLAEHVRKRNRPSTQAEVTRIVERHIRPRLGRHKVAAVTRQDIGKLHREVAGTPRQANVAVAICSKAFALAEAWGMRPESTNPCSKIERYPESTRERFLTADELARLGATLRQAETTGLPWTIDPQRPISKHLAKEENRRTLLARVTTAAVELLLFTGCRLSEVLNLRWAQVDLDAGTITLAQTKSGRPQVIVINGPARQVLAQLPRPKGSPWVLPSTTDAEKPLSKTAIEKAWSRIRAAAKIEDVRLHDLRHTVGTYAGQAGANAFLVRDLLRHKTLAMTGRYVNRADDP
ncbi:tyrosine-type recombinase/integrase, partial [Rhodovulum sp. PH10]|uniref:tyrosine-type recombinase/integrase n=1 Tax=Rhodovulum sp. PH10 TaxID=1187851 RepID=UPI0005910032